MAAHASQTQGTVLDWRDRSMPWRVCRTNGVAHSQCVNTYVKDFILDVAGSGVATPCWCARRDLAQSLLTTRPSWVIGIQTCPFRVWGMPFGRSGDRRIESNSPSKPSQDGTCLHP